MQDQLRDRMAVYLAQHSTGILSTAAAAGAWAMAVRYRPLPAAGDNHGLAVACLVPRWTDVAYYIEQNPHVQFVIHDPPPSTSPSPLPGETTGRWRWLQVAGTAEAIAAPDWDTLLSGWASAAPPDDLYLALRVTPTRLDLFDETRGWGARETVEL